MKKTALLLISFAAFAASLPAQSQVTENKDVVNMGSGVTANQTTGYKPSVTLLSGGAVEYREYTPELSLSLLGVRGI